MYTKEITLDKLAEKLRISKYSVSRALSGKPGVSKETREKVFEVARELGYRHASLQDDFRALAGEARNVVLLVPAGDLQNSEFWLGIISGAAMEADRLGLTLVTRPIDNNLPDGQIPNRPLGLIVAGRRAREAMSPYLSLDIPTILITYPMPLESFDTVTIADWEGGFVVGDHLMKLGHKRIIFVNDDPQDTSRSERLRGLISASKAYGNVKIKEVQIGPSKMKEAIEGICTKGLNRKGSATALFCCTDGVAFNVLWVLNSLNLDVPEIVSVVGYNDEKNASALRLTTIRPPLHDIGAAAVQRLYKRLTGQDQGPPKRLLLAPHIVLRESTAPPR